MPTDLPPADPDRRRSREPSGGSTSPPGVPGSTAPDPRSALRGVQGWILIITLALVLVLVALPLIRDPIGAAARKVRLVDPVVRTAPDFPPDQAARLTMAALDSLERQLATRKGLWIVPSRRRTSEEAIRPKTSGPGTSGTGTTGPGKAGPEKAAGTGGPPPADVFAAEEELVLELDCGGELCRGSLRRIRTIDGIATYHRPGFRLPIDDLLEFVDELAEELQLAYLRHGTRQEGSGLFVDRETYRHYLRLRRWERAAGLPTVSNLSRALDETRLPDCPGSSLPGGRSIDDLLGSTQRIRRDFPRFGDAYLLAARLHLCRDGEGDRKAALDLLTTAARISPGDYRPPELAVPLALALGHLDRVEDGLERLDLLLPGDPRVAGWHRAVTRLRAAVVAEPSSEAGTGEGGAGDGVGRGQGK